MRRLKRPKITNKLTSYFFIVTLMTAGAYTLFLMEFFVSGFEGSARFHLLAEANLFAKAYKTDNTVSLPSSSTVQLSYDELPEISKEGINEWTSTNKPTLNLFLDPRQNNNLLNTVEYHFKDTIMVTKILKVFGSRSFRIIDKSKETYSILYAKDSSLIEKNRRYQFENRKVDLKIFKDSIKEIGGYKCFKVLYVEKENFEYNGIQLSKLYPNNRVFTEMYVTDSIESNYHPTINNKFILDKYYPLEIRYYSNLFKGKETTLKVTSLKKI